MCLNHLIALVVIEVCEPVVSSHVQIGMNVLCNEQDSIEECVDKVS